MKNIKVIREQGINELVTKYLAEYIERGWTFLPSRRLMSSDYDYYLFLTKGDETIAIGCYRGWKIDFYEVLEIRLFKVINNQPLDKENDNVRVLDAFVKSRDRKGYKFLPIEVLNQMAAKGAERRANRYALNKKEFEAKLKTVAGFKRGVTKIIRIENRYYLNKDGKQKIKTLKGNR